MKKMCVLKINFKDCVPLKVNLTRSVTYWILRAFEGLWGIGAFIAGNPKMMSSFGEHRKSIFSFYLIGRIRQLFRGFPTPATPLVGHKL